MTGDYGDDLAWVHHCGFGDLARNAAATVVRGLRRAGHRQGLVVDLGCGSGILARALVDAGYDVLGVDPSEAMLRQAAEEAPRARFVQASLADIDAVLPPSCVAVTAVGEIFSYAGCELDEPFARIGAALVPGGLFLLDVVGPGRMRAPASVREDAAAGWFITVRYTEDSDTLTRQISLFRRTGAGAYRRSDVTHHLRVHPPAVVEGALAAAGFAVRRLRGYGSVRAGRGWTVFSATMGSPSTNDTVAMRSDRQPPPV